MATTTTKAVMRNLKAGMSFTINGRVYQAISDAIFIGDKYDGEYYVESSEDGFFEHEFA